MAIRKSAASTRRSRLQFSLKQLLIGVAVVALVLGIWVRWFRKVVYVREARPDDTIAGKHFGFEIAHAYFGINREDLEVRNIAVATGNFRNGRWLTTSLYLVRSGVIDEANSMGLSKSQARLGLGSHLLGERYQIRLALGEAETPQGRVTFLGASGQTTGAGTGGGKLTHSIAATHATTLPGQITPGRPYIVYVEGDREPVVNRETSLEEFAEENPGNYLVVVLQLD
jgi:hypothetical protein